jgi:hypothetical protein
VPTFYLYHGIPSTGVFDYRDNSRTLLPEPRAFIDSEDHPYKDNTILGQVEADNWQEAKFALGYF